MTETATNSATNTPVFFHDWKSKQKESDTTSVPVIDEEEVATSIELEQLIPHIAT